MHPKYSDVSSISGWTQSRSLIFWSRLHRDRFRSIAIVLDRSRSITIDLYWSRSIAIDWNHKINDLDQSRLMIKWSRSIAIDLDYNFYLDWSRSNRDWIWSRLKISIDLDQSRLRHTFIRIGENPNSKLIKRLFYTGLQSFIRFYFTPYSYIFWISLK